MMKTLILLSTLFFSATLAGQAPAKKEKPAAKKTAAKKKKIPGKIERIRMVLKFGNSEQVRDTVNRLKRLKEDEQKKVMPDLKKLLKQKDPLVKAAVARFVGQTKLNDLDESILPLLESDLPDIVGPTLAAIERKKIKKAAPLLIKKVKAADYTKASRFTAEYINTLGEFKEQKVADFIFTKVKDDTVLGRYKGPMLIYFGKAGVKKPAITKYLVDMVKNKDADMKLRPYAVNAIGHLKLSSASTDLKKTLEEIDKITDIDEKKRNAKLRLQLITALVRLKSPGVIEVLMNMAKDDDSTVRISAIRQLGRLKSNEAKELLEFKSKYDPNPKVQKAAKKALKQIGGKTKT